VAIAVEEVDRLATLALELGGALVVLRFDAAEVAAQPRKEHGIASLSESWWLLSSVLCW